MATRAMATRSHGASVGIGAISVLWRHAREARPLRCRASSTSQRAESLAMRAAASRPPSGPRSSWAPPPWVARTARARSPPGERRKRVRARQILAQRLDSGLERRYRKKRWVIPIRQQYPRPLDPARRALRVALHAQARRPLRVLPTGRLLCFFSSAT